MIEQEKVELHRDGFLGGLAWVYTWLRDTGQPPEIIRSFARVNWVAVARRRYPDPPAERKDGAK